MTEEYFQPNDDDEVKKQYYQDLFSPKVTKYSYDPQNDEDIYKLLDFAEDIKKICDNYIEKLEQLIVTRDFIIATLGLLYCVSISMIIYFFFRNSIWNSILFLITPVFITSIFILIFTILCFSILFNSRIKKLETKLEYEEKVLIETVSLIREAGNLMVSSEHWTKFQKIEFKIRLSRFNTGKYKMPQSVFRVFF